MQEQQLRQTVERIVGECLANHVEALKTEIVDKACDELQVLAPAGPAPVSPAASASTDVLNAAVNSLRDCTTQADILTSLMDGVSRFAERGALFVIRSGAAAGWRAVGLENKDAIKALTLELNDGLAARAFKERVPASGSASEFDAQFESTYGAPAEGTNVLVLPLVVRDKVAALVYADAGMRLDGNLNQSALETLVHCAGMWLEVQAARKAGTRTDVGTDSLRMPKFTDAAAPSEEQAPSYGPQPAAISEERIPVYEPNTPSPLERIPTYDPPPPRERTTIFEQPSPVPVFDPQPTMSPEAIFASVAAATDFETSPSAVATPSLMATPAAAVATMDPNATTNIPIPPGLAPDEEELHKKAKRFAKLLVDEIKLYNQSKVAEGRAQRNLYQVLRDDIDKSRATYDKRYGATLASSGNYFTRELIRILANDDPSLLGSDFSG
jgi:hypothetical protein